MSDTSYAVFQHYGTNAQRLAFTPSPAATGQPIYVWYETDTDTTWIYTTGWHQVSGSGGGVTASGTLTSNRIIKGAGTSVVTVGDLTGDVTTSGTMATTLANSGVSASSYGSAIVTFDAKGRATAATQNYLQYREEQAQNTNGGTFTSGAWRTRVLNTEVSDVGGFGSLASNQITLTSGDYRIRAVAPAHAIDRHQARLQNVTDATTILIGTSEFNANASTVSQTSSLVSGVFTIAASKALELQHQCQTTKATLGFGIAANFTTEVYSVVELWKIG